MRPVKLKDLRVRVLRPCASCGGKGRVPGGQVEYGELVDCPLCQKGRVSGSIAWDEFVRLVRTGTPDTEVEFT